MASISSALPAPIKSYEVFSDTADRQAAAARPPKVLPPYGRRQGFVPRSQEDFGGGGAYPEVHVAQFPLDMGRPGRAASTGTSTALVPLSVDSQTGQARFDAIITAQHRGKNVHTQFGALVEKRPEDVVRMRPSAEEEAAVAARTNAALSGIVAHTLTNARTSTVDPNAKSRSDEAKFIRYTPSTDTPGFSEATKQRVIRLVEAPVDPLEPPKFKHKKVPGGPPDAPVPVMHSPPRKVTAEDQEAWRIPSAMSNWKNPHGYVIPLDKRLAADGRSLLEPVINDNFAKLSEALLIAERKARVEVETRAAIQKKLAVKESEAKEAELRALAAKARAERAGIANLAEGGGAPPTAAAAAGLVDFEGAGSSASASAGRAPAAGGVGASRGAGGGGVGVGGDLLGGSYDSDGEDGGGRQQAAPGFITGGRGAAEAAEDYEAAKERDQLRAERKRERERELRTEAGGKRSRVARDDERDVSERIALGMPVGTGAAGGGGAEALYDSRLFNQAEGMQSGFTAEDEYAVYSAPWRSEAATSGGAAGSYRPRAGLGAGGEGGGGPSAEEQLRKLQDASKFGGGGGGKDFEGVSAGARGAGGAVQFEKAAAGTVGSSASAADPFGLDQFLSTKPGAGSAGGGNALSGIGSRGFMAAAGGGVARSAEEYAGGSGRDKIAFRSGGTTR